MAVTLNDIVLAMAAGALRQLLLRYDGCADSPLIAGVPVSYNTSPERLVGNEFTYMTPSLPVHIDDPLERVKLTAMATAIAKENHPLLGPTLLPAWLTSFRRRRAADVPQAGQPDGIGERHEPDHLERAWTAGARQHRGRDDHEIYSVGPVVAGSGMNITVWSYVDQLAISVLTDDLTLEDPHEATDAMIDAFIEIRRAAGLPADLTPVGDTLPLTAATG